MLPLYINMLTLFPVAGSFTNHITFAPNQLAANLWYHAGLNGSLVNGHINGSFANMTLWRELQQRLAHAPRGALGVTGAELSHMSDRTLASIRRAGLATSAADPTFTQCRDGKVLGQLSFLGQHAELFCSIFTICPPGALARGGWYQSGSATPYAPDEITMDERMPNLLPSPKHLEQLWNQSLPSWTARKEAAFVDKCPTAAIFNPGTDRITGLIGDYLEFLDVAAARFGKGKIPRISVHWNVIAWWEWTDVQCLDTLASKQLAPAEFQHAIQYLTEPCHRDTEHLQALVSAMCGHGTCPAVVYMDVDYIYNTRYALDVLERNKRALRALNVSFGLDIVDLCGANLACVITVDSSGQQLLRTEVQQGDSLQQQQQQQPNLMQEQSLRTLVEFLVQHEILDQHTHLRIQSWTVRPIEQGVQVDEKTNGSMAHTANSIIQDIQQLLQARSAASKTE